MRIIDEWIGGACFTRQYSYRIVEGDNGSTWLEWKRQEEEEECYSKVERGHGVARQVAELLLLDKKVIPLVKTKVV